MNPSPSAFLVVVVVLSPSTMVSESFSSSFLTVVVVFVPFTLASVATLVTVPFSSS